jgi:hypothetical protein
MGGSAEKEKHRAGKQGRKVYHGADAYKKKQGHGFGGMYARLKKPLDNARFL